MKKIVLLCFCLAAAVTSMAQARTVYFELLGPGLASFNFDTRFGKSQKGFGGRVGGGAFVLSDVAVGFVPVGVNYLMGNDGRHYFELGTGVTITMGNVRDDNFSGSFGHVLFGYRLQPESSGFSFRAFISPVFGRRFFLPYYGGLSLGYKF